MTSDLHRKRIELEPGGNDRVIGWRMNPDEVSAFFAGQRKTVITFVGYSVDYEDETLMLKTAEEVLTGYSPQTYLINIGATSGGVGAIYPIAKGMGFITTGIVSTLAIKHLENISPAVDHVCFVQDTQWGGKIADSNTLSPTSQAMVNYSDILVGIGGGEISRDEMLAGREQGKPVHFFPAEISHAFWIRRANKMNLPVPDNFWGAAHEVFGK